MLLVCGLILAIILAALAIADACAGILPNELNALLTIGAVAQLLTVGTPAPLDAVGGALLVGVAALFRRLRGIEGLGMGDQKFGFAAGLWIGWEQVPLMLLVATATALLFVGLRTALRSAQATARLPFGPFLGAGVLASWLNVAFQ
jgi:leader peptidase (prepilin peptidase)/N-methyltransferase